MFGFLWDRFCDLIMVSRPVEKCLMDRAMEVAERVKITRVSGGLLQGCCPVCSEAILSVPVSDVRMLLATHLCMFHVGDVDLLWDMMPNKKEPQVVHRPSFLFVAVMLAAGVVALTELWAKNSAMASSTNGRSKASGDDFLWAQISSME